MAFREVSVVVVKEILRLWLSGHGYRSVARLAMVDPKTVRRYVKAAVAAGLDRERGEQQLTEELLGSRRRGRPARTSARGPRVKLAAPAGAQGVHHRAPGAGPDRGPDRAGSGPPQGRAGSLPNALPVLRDRVRDGREASLFAGEEFASLTDARRRAERWCLHTAGLRIHGTTARRPLEVFRLEEAQALAPAPEAPYDLPHYACPKVHRDYHIEVDRALYSVPAAFIGGDVLVFL